MANDLWNVVSELRNWRRVHLIGFSMGGMIASKAASMYPEKVLSLTLLSTPQCGIHIMLPSWRTLKVIARVIPRCLLFRWCPLCQQKHCKEVTRHMRTFMELYLKYSEYYLLELMMKDTEDNKASVVPRWCCMEQQQGDDGQTHSLPTSISTAGQLRAIVCHRLTSEETKKIRRASWPVLCISGKYDQLVSARCCRSLARQLSADYITLPGAHFITEECSKQLHQLIRLFLEKKLVLLDEKTPWYFV
jgi:pimeloyl-ACP methyl ester carboxylesterase